MGALDIGLSLAVVALAVVFLLSRFRQDKTPACHDDGGHVEVGAGLARGLERARRRDRD